MAIDLCDVPSDVPCLKLKCLEPKCYPGDDDTSCSSQAELKMSRCGLYSPLHTPYLQTYTTCCSLDRPMPGWIDLNLKTFFSPSFFLRDLGSSQYLAVFVS